MRRRNGLLRYLPPGATIALVGVMTRLLIEGKLADKWLAAVAVCLVALFVWAFWRIYRPGD